MSDFPTWNACPEHWQALADELGVEVPEGAHRDTIRSAVYAAVESGPAPEPDPDPEPELAVDITVDDDLLD